MSEAEAEREKLYEKIIPGSYRYAYLLFFMLYVH